MASWNNDYDFNLLAQKIEGEKNTLPDGNVSFESPAINEYDVLLFSMVKFSEEIPEKIARNIVESAIFEAGRRGTITADSLMRAINASERRYLNLPIQRFILVTSLSISPVNRMKNIIIGNTEIIFNNQLNPRITRERNDLIRDAAYRLFAEIPNNYRNVRVHVSARSDHEAAEKGLDSLDFVRGVWNWMLNRSQFIRISMGRPESVNTIVLGPIHTLHRLNGEIVSKVWWYEPFYLGAMNRIYFVNEQEILASMKFLEKVRRKLSTHPYQKAIKEAIINYTRALDERNWYNAYMRLWIVLEKLTDTRVNVNYKITSERTAFLFDDYKYQMQVLKHLRDFRNEYAHSGAENSEIETYMYQLKRCVEGLLSFHLRNRFNFQNISEAALFLSQSSESETIKYKLKLLRAVKRFRNI